LDFDLEFAEAFYTGEWMKDVDQESIVSQINCPTVYIKARTLYGKDVILYAANSDKDAERVNSLLKNTEFITLKSGHDIHFEKPKNFINILVDSLNEITN
jgi:pimeloyl-ACP methyl ester carboxylesterase